MLRPTGPAGTAGNSGAALSVRGPRLNAWGQSRMIANPEDTTGHTYRKNLEDDVVDWALQLLRDLDDAPLHEMTPLFDTASKN